MGVPCRCAWWVHFLVYHRRRVRDAQPCLAVSRQDRERLEAQASLALQEECILSTNLRRSSIEKCNDTSCRHALPPRVVTQPTVSPADPRGDCNALASSWSGRTPCGQIIAKPLVHSWQYSVLVHCLFLVNSWQVLGAFLVNSLFYSVLVHSW